MKNVIMRALISPGVLVWRITKIDGLLNGWCVIVGPVIRFVNRA